MPVRTDQIMSNDSLAASLFQGHDYNRSLVGDSLVWQEQWPSMSPEPTEQTDYIGRFFDSIIDFLASVPTAVYALIGVVLAACLAYWIYRSRLFYANPEVGDGNWDKDAEDIYAVDVDSELDKARRQNDYAAIVRYVYLHTLRVLDESHRIDWRIYKTPSQYSNEFAHPAFATMTRHFLRVRYGKFPATPALCDEMSALAQEVEKGGEA